MWFESSKTSYIKVFRNAEYMFRINFVETWVSMGATVQILPFSQKFVLEPPLKLIFFANPMAEMDSKTLTYEVSAGSNHICGQKIFPNRCENENVHSKKNPEYWFWPLIFFIWPLLAKTYHHTKWERNLRRAHSVPSLSVDNAMHWYSPIVERAYNFGLWAAHFVREIL